MGALRNEGHEQVGRAELHSLPSALLRDNKGDGSNGNGHGQKQGWAAGARSDHHHVAMARLRQAEEERERQGRPEQQEVSCWQGHHKQILSCM
jgi:hypothetical protein